MKSTHSVDTAPKGITGSTRRHIISRLHKAATYANELVKLLGDRETTGASETDILEARAYCACLSGAMKFEKQNWEDSLKFYSEARVIYDTLTSSTKKDTFRDLLSTAIDPSIRYSAYQRQLPRTVAIPTIARRYFPHSDSELVTAIEKLDPDALSEKPSQKKGSAAAPDSVPKTITWRSRTVALEDASIALALAAVSTASGNLSTFLSSPRSPELMPKEKAAAYDDVLTASQDAVDATKRAIDELIAEGVDQGDKRMQGLQVTKTAVNYALVGWRIGRNRVLSGEHDGASMRTVVARKPKKSGKSGKPHAEKEGKGGKLSKLRERVALYDATLQSLDSVKELPGVAADEPFLKELQGKRLYFQALKCLAIARSHDVLGNRKEALALFDRAFSLSGQSQALASPTSATQPLLPGLDIQPAEVEYLRQLLQAEVFRFRALVELDNTDESSSKKLNGQDPKNKTPLLEKLSEFPTGGITSLNNLVTYPPVLEPVPVKPLFFDVAWNYINYPRTATQPVEKPEAVDSNPAGSAEDGAKHGGKKGWFGFGR
ncbi:hypothetical protein GP486_006254 [Trichoglossum hirsutum]|uniref:Signal recognition particle subunit SRP68 n=1 Tax=Trichoglossum hirsutum TaxID=265104 RepID=A0A9P8I8G1_9PEZI|nr:hypothetical protein GP486_006254 [Trichoglossum hirsutum]